MRFLSRNEKMANRYRKNPTPPEEILRAKLLDGVCGYTFGFQVPLLNYILDFYSPELNFGIEIDGKAHKYTINRRRVRERDQRLWEEAGVMILRVSARALYENPEEVLERIGVMIKNLEKIDRDSPLLRLRAKTSRVISYSPEEKKELIRRLEARGKIDKKSYSPC